MRIFLFSLCLLLNLSACAHIQPSFSNLSANNIKQVLTVKPLHHTYAQVILWERLNDQWVKRYGPVLAQVGRTGIISAQIKKEGDGHTPAGIYSLTQAFAKYPVQTGLDYRIITREDIWVDDPESPKYNQWIQLPTEAKSFENLYRLDNLYDMAIIVDYNRHQPEPYKGSAIFIHTWRNYHHPTSGCIALKVRDLRRILALLNKESNPQVYIYEN